MGIKVTQEAAIPDGAHKGIVTASEIKKVVFDPARGLEETLEIVIQPAWKKDTETQTLAVRVSFSPSLNGLSALSRLLDRLNMKPKPGTEWQPSDLVGTEIQFAAKRNAAGFVNLDKDSIRAV